MKRSKGKAGGASDRFAALCQHDIPYHRHSPGGASESFRTPPAYSVLQAELSCSMASTVDYRRSPASAQKRASGPDRRRIGGQFAATRR